MMKVTVRHGDITQEMVDAIVNPANSHGLMGGGVAYAIKTAGGQEIENEAVSQTPIGIGVAVSTTAGSLKSKYVIHAPTMIDPAMPASIESVKKSTRAALECAKGLGVKTIAFPGMGSGVGGLSYDLAVETMVEVMVEYTVDNPVFNEIILVAFNDELYKVFKKWSMILGLETG